MSANITKTCIIINLSKCAVNLDRVKLIDCQSNLEKVHYAMLLSVTVDRWKMFRAWAVIAHLNPSPLWMKRLYDWSEAVSNTFKYYSAASGTNAMASSSWKWSSASSAGINSWTRMLPLSTTKTWPRLSTPNPYGKLNCP